MIPLEERFWSKVEKTGDCWNWTAGKNLDGYGRFAHRGQMRPAHRISYELMHGDIPPGMVIDHICRNHSCVRPEHLRALTNKQNVENRAGAMPTSKSGVRGVWRSRNRWVARVKHNGKVHHVGTFTDINAAAEAVRKARLQIFTHSDMDRPGNAAHGAAA